MTFGTEPSDPFSPPSSNVTMDVDGALHSIVGSPTDSVHSGLFGPAPGERVGAAQTPLGVTRFRVTFTAPGTFRCICALHDDEGMVGTVGGAAMKPRLLCASFVLSLAVMHGEAASYLGGLVNPPLPKPKFTLTDTAGAPFDFWRNTQGAVTLLFFGTRRARTSVLSTWRTSP